LHPNKIGRVICNGCKKEFTYVDLEMDHIKPWSKGGKTELENAQLLCKHCNTSKGNK
jgi:5-methylcytosine-specific restriction endonuclease McrA